jgi:hypothetical protein
MIIGRMYYNRDSIHCPYLIPLRGLHTDFMMEESIWVYEVWEVKDGCKSVVDMSLLRQYALVD